MKNYFILSITLLLFSVGCEKDEDNQQNQSTSNQSTTYFMELQFTGDYIVTPPTVTINGSEITSYSLNVETGDFVKIESTQGGQTNTSTGVVSWDSFEVTMMLDGVEETVQSCTCQNFSHEHVIP